MKHLISAALIATLFSVNCLAAEDVAPSASQAKTIETSLFSVAVPAVSIDAGGLWQQYAQASSADDVVIKQGTRVESYTQRSGLRAIAR